MAAYDGGLRSSGAATSQGRGPHRLFPAAGGRSGRKRGGRQCALAAEEGRTARGAAAFCRPGGPAKPTPGGGPKAPAPALCALCAPAAPGGAGKSPGPRLMGAPTLDGAGRHNALAERDMASFPRLGQSRCPRPTGSGGIARPPRDTGPRELQRTVREYRRARSTAVRVAPPPAQGPLPTAYGQRRHSPPAAGCRAKRIAADGARISPCA